MYIQNEILQNLKIYSNGKRSIKSTMFKVVNIVIYVHTYIKHTYTYTYQPTQIVDKCIFVENSPRPLHLTFSGACSLKLFNLSTRTYVLLYCSGHKHRTAHSLTLYFAAQLDHIP